MGTFAMNARSRVLIVEDERLVQATLAGMLRSAGFAPLTAGSVAEAAALIETQEFDLAIVDILLPDGRGIDVCASITKSKRTPVLILTAYGDPALMDEAAAAGAKAYLVKPVGSNELIAAAGRLIAQASAESKRDSELSIEKIDVRQHEANN
jgi:two-component system, OmpR family, KDP operon response regulator KdpE